MFYSSEAYPQSNLSRPYLPSEKLWKHFDGQNIKRWLWSKQYLKKAAQASEGIAQKGFLVTPESVTISQNTSLSRNIHSPLRCGRNSARFSSLVVTQLARQDKPHCILPNITILSARGVSQFFPSLPTTPLLKCLSYLHAQENLSIPS